MIIFLGIRNLIKNSTSSREIVSGNDFLANVGRLNSICTLRQVSDILFNSWYFIINSKISLQVDVPGCVGGDRVSHEQ